jgi:hypothetical protein
MSEKLSVQELGREVLKGLAEIRKKQAEAARLMKKLENRAMAMLSGVHPDNVATWGYDPAVDKRRHRHPAIWNFVLLRDKTRVDLDPPVPMDSNE